MADDEYVSGWYGLLSVSKSGVLRYIYKHVYTYILVVHTRRKLLYVTEFKRQIEKKKRGNKLRRANNTLTKSAALGGNSSGRLSRCRCINSFRFQSVLLSSSRLFADGQLFRVPVPLTREFGAIKAGAVRTKQIDTSRNVLGSGIRLGSGRNAAGRE